MTDKPNLLTPPPEHAMHRWHWIETEHGLMAASWLPMSDSNGAWDISGHYISVDSHRTKSWTYMGPAIPPAAWRPPSQPAGGQCAALDENGEECCAFSHGGKWYLCSNVSDPKLEFTPRAWTRLPVAPVKAKE